MAAVLRERTRRYQQEQRGEATQPGEATQRGEPTQRGERTRRYQQEQRGEPARRFGDELFAEAYIDGREFNLSLLCGPRGPQVLPPAEIDFVDYPPEKPHIVGYAAKWDDRAFEYHATPRRFDVDEADRGLVETLRALAVHCWRLFDLRGHVRVDFRVDERNQPWILEVNANPCLSPEAGFMAAAARAGLTIEHVVERLLRDAVGS
ncbi:MAG: hypothetical protein C4547_05880 [Phycisphaerales bacterium]|nr:MAG: hypothetical protein C4547_05880 [Phycisphaerales bacterium]